MESVNNSETETQKIQQTEVSSESLFKRACLPILGAGLAIGGLFRAVPTAKRHKLRVVKDAVARSRNQSGQHGTSKA